MRLKIARSFGPWLVLLGLALAAPALQAAKLPDFTELVEANGPAVVNISTTQKTTPGEGRQGLPPGMENIPGLPEDHPFNEFFRRFFEDDGPPGGFDAQSLGSGFIISADGYVLTNHHVVKDADEIIVRLSDRRELPAEVVGRDKRSDLALLKIDATGLPTARIGNSEELKVGEWVLAIGSPFGFDHSVTAGIVSAKGRSLPSENYVPFIQTDVAINPGNSGGPLFNLDGEVVGINSQIFTRSGGFMGLSFAIPIDVAMDVVEQLKTKGHVTRGWLGVLIQDVTRELAESFGMERPSGALVADVLADSPAEKAGVKVGDIIVEFAGRRVQDSGQLPPLVGSAPVGETTDMVVIRDGKRKTLEVTLGELPPEEELRQTRSQNGKTQDSRVGLEVSDPSEAERKRLGLPAGQGVVVEAVQDGPAQEAGLRPGDGILKINNKTVRDAAHFASLVRDLPPGRSVPILVRRESGPLFLALKIPK